MPNTIAHFAINGLFTRAIISQADFKWIYLGCIIPDLPWILQRVVKALPYPVDLYDLRAFCIIQSSFLLCFFVSAACAMLAKKRSKVFLILIIGCLLHLLLDAVQIKWANGVQLFAPLNWSLVRFDFFWPESVGTYVLMAAGLVYFIFNIKNAIQPNCDEFSISVKSLLLSGFLFLSWLVLPFIFIQSAYVADNHFIDTLKDVQNRTSKNIEIDRNRIVSNEGKVMLKTSFGESIRLDNIQVQQGDLISLQGRFSDNSTIHVNHYHVHTGFRDIASMLGLLCVLLVWLVFIARCCTLRIKGQ